MSDELKIFGKRVRSVPDDGDPSNCAKCALNTKCHYRYVPCWNYGGGKIHFELVNG